MIGSLINIDEGEAASVVRNIMQNYKFNLKEFRALLAAQEALEDRIPESPSEERFKATDTIETGENKYLLDGECLYCGRKMVARGFSYCPYCGHPFISKKDNSVEVFVKPNYEWIKLYPDTAGPYYYTKKEEREE